MSKNTQAQSHANMQLKNAFGSKRKKKICHKQDLSDLGTIVDPKPLFQRNCLHDPILVFALVSFPAPSPEVIKTGRQVSSGN